MNTTEHQVLISIPSRAGLTPGSLHAIMERIGDLRTDRADEIDLLLAQVTTEPNVVPPSRMVTELNIDGEQANIVVRANAHSEQAANELRRLLTGLVQQAMRDVEANPPIN